jgi:peptidoglycan/LPS O-acetylase OafA/YrhL
MRGIAAVVVVLFHTSLVAQPSLETSKTGDVWWWIADSPLKLATAGAEAVLIFFVLSGLVVAIPAFRTGFSWLKYYPSRIIRLYVPSIAALAFGALLIILVPRAASAVTKGFWAYDTNARSVPPLTLLADFSLFKAGNGVDNVLWSLRWEVIFSLLLPLFVFLAVKVRRFWIVAIALCLAVTATGTGAHLDPRLYLPVFFIGTLMALHLTEIQDWSRQRSRGFWISALVASLLFLIGSHTLSFLFPTASIVGHILTALVATGASGLILCAIGFSAVRNTLNRRVPQFLGRISFSLYLVHVPILATLAYFLGDQLWWIVAVVGIPLSVGVAVLFLKFIEGPSQKLARFVGGKLAGLRTPAEVPEPERVRPKHPENRPVGVGARAEVGASK